MEWSIGVYRCHTPEGIRQYVSYVPREHVFAHGLTPKAIVGVLLRPLEPGEGITPAVFARNPVFVDFMHEVIATFDSVGEWLFPDRPRAGSMPAGGVD